MIYLNFSTVEELLFYDRDAQKHLPMHMFGLFEQWRLAKMMPMLRDLGKAALLDVLNGLTDSDVASLEEYFNDRIFLEKLNYSIVRNIKVPLKDQQEICKNLCELEGFNYFSTWRDSEYLYLSLWR